MRKLSPKLDLKWLVHLISALWKLASFVFSILSTAT
jgi:hypothetical protein